MIIRYWCPQCGDYFCFETGDRSESTAEFYDEGHLTWWIEDIDYIGECFVSHDGILEISLSL